MAHTDPYHLPLSAESFSLGVPKLGRGLARHAFILGIEVASFLGILYSQPCDTQQGEDGPVL